MRVKKVKCVGVHLSHYICIIFVAYIFCESPNSVSVVIGANVPKKSAATMSIQNEALVMPVWLRKAGGTFHSELLQAASQPTSANVETSSHDAEKDNKKVKTSDNSIQGKIEPSPFSEDSFQKRNKEPDVMQTDDYTYDNWEDEDPECPEDQFYHIRGKQCVPLTCPGGNLWRDRDTGMCILKRYGPRRKDWRNPRQWRP